MCCVELGVHIQAFTFSSQDHGRLSEKHISKHSRWRHSQDHGRLNGVHISKHSLFSWRGHRCVFMCTSGVACVSLLTCLFLFFLLLLFSLFSFICCPSLSLSFTARTETRWTRMHHAIHWIKRELSICQSLLCHNLGSSRVLGQIKPQAPLLVVPIRPCLIFMFCAACLDPSFLKILCIEKLMTANCSAECPTQHMRRSCGAEDV